LEAGPRAAEQAVRRRRIATAGDEPQGSARRHPLRDRREGVRVCGGERGGGDNEKLPAGVKRVAAEREAAKHVAAEREAATCGAAERETVTRGAAERETVTRAATPAA
jgi:hypothetical protein